MMSLLEHVSDAFIGCIKSHQPEKDRLLLKPADEYDFEATQNKGLFDPVMVSPSSIVRRLFAEPASASQIKTKTESKICKFIIIVKPCKV